MKSRQDFTRSDDYEDYLRAYFTSIALSRIADNDESPEDIAKEAVTIADATLVQLGM